MIQAVILGIYLKEMKSLSWGYVCVLSHLSRVWLFVTLWTLFWMWMVVLVGWKESDTTERLNWTELVALMVKNPLIYAGDNRNANLIPGPGESHGQRSLVGLQSMQSQSQTWLSMHTPHPAYFLSIKKKEILQFMTTWMNFEGIMLSKLSQREEDKYYIILLTCRI